MVYSSYSDGRTEGRGRIGREKAREGTSPSPQKQKKRASVLLGNKKRGRAVTSCDLCRPKYSPTDIYWYVDSTTVVVSSFCFCPLVLFSESCIRAGWTHRRTCVCTQYVDSTVQLSCAVLFCFFVLSVALVLAPTFRWSFRLASSWYDPCATRSRYFESERDGHMRDMYHCITALTVTISCPVPFFFVRCCSRAPNYATGACGEYVERTFIHRLLLTVSCPVFLFCRCRCSCAPNCLICRAWWTRRRICCRSGGRA